MFECDAGCPRKPANASSANPLWFSESNVSICGRTLNNISDHFFSIFITSTDFDLAAGTNPFSAVA